jgi:flagellar biogenesis protein FliO
MPITTELMMNYLMGATSIVILVLIYIGFSIYRLKRMIRKQIEYENSNQEN